MQKYSAAEHPQMADFVRDKENKIVVHLLLKKDKQIANHIIDQPIFLLPLIGTLKVSSATKELLLHPGDFLAIPKNYPHSISAQTTCDLIFIACD
ncbi:hypothetical protein AwErysi_04640 [Erysipelotrichaceae bacterium]|nr:hypothetical protein AwErysi_04640 [Erysipelotrichaceae bacterium]